MVPVFSLAAGFTVAALYLHHSNVRTLAERFGVDTYLGVSVPVVLLSLFTLFGVSMAGVLLGTIILRRTDQQTDLTVVSRLPVGLLFGLGIYLATFGGFVSFGFSLRWPPGTIAGCLGAVAAVAASRVPSLLRTLVPRRFPMTW